MTLLLIGAVAGVLPATAGVVPGGATAAGAAQPTATASAASWGWKDRGPMLHAVSCASPSQCVAVGDKGFVLRTADGGATLQWSMVPWTAAETSADDILAAIHCQASTCMAVSRGTTATSVSHVYRSTDAGAQWSDLGPLPKAAGGTQIGGAIGCAPGGNCVIVGPTGGIWRSVVGSATLSPIVAPKGTVPYTSVTCPAVNTCLALSAGKTGSRIEGAKVVSSFSFPTTGKMQVLSCGTATSCVATDNLATTFKSTDGGRTWKSLGKTVPQGVVITTLTCPQPGTCVGLTGTGTAIRTTNLGETWKVYPTGAPGPAGPTAIGCAAASCATVGDHALFQMSTDGGLQWDTVNAVPDISALSCRATGAPVCLSGGKSDIGLSTTNGEFWHSPVEGLTSLDAESASCLTPQSCMVIAKQYTLTSQDDGEHWQFGVPAGSVASGPAAATCVTALYCVGVGSGIVYTTLNGATTWWVSSVPGGPMMDGISCPTSTICVASAANGNVYRGVRTVDPAHPSNVAWSWRGYGTDVASPLNSISCATALSCVAVGFGGVTLRSADGGQTWVKTITNTTDAWHAVTCQSATLCVAGGTSGAPTPDRILLAVSTDGGQTWARHIGTAGTIATIDCPTADRCLAAGSTVLVGTP